MVYLRPLLSTCSPAANVKTGFVVGVGSRRWPPLGVLFKHDGRIRVFGLVLAGAQDDTGLGWYHDRVVH